MDRKPGSFKQTVNLNMFVCMCTRSRYKCFLSVSDNIKDGHQYLTQCITMITVDLDVAALLLTCYLSSDWTNQYFCIWEKHLSTASRMATF